MAQPQWITPAGDLGTVAEGLFFTVPVVAVDPDGGIVKYRLIAGRLPAGVQVKVDGSVEGTPLAYAIVRGTPTEVSENITSRFAVRAYIEGLNGQVRLADRTFQITVTGQDLPKFVTPAGNIGFFYDGDPVNFQIKFTDEDPGDIATASLEDGELPPGLSINAAGLISGYIDPIASLPDTAIAGFDRTGTAWDQFPFDFSSRSASKNYEFTVQLSDGKDRVQRTFTMFVVSRDSLSADLIEFFADNTFITADVTTTRTPVLLTPPGDLGRVRANNFFAFRFRAIDLDGDPIEFSITTGVGIGYDETPFDELGIGFDRGAFSLPPGLTINPNTGIFSGYIPDQGATEYTYKFGIQVKKANAPTFISPLTFFTITIIGQVDTEVTWLTNPDLGIIRNGDPSILYVSATNRGGRVLQYRLASGTDSKLPQGLTLQSSGNITGRVSFNTFAIDKGRTTFDKKIQTRLQKIPTTFDLKFNFTVNAFSSETEEVGYGVSTISVINGGSGYSTQPTITISAPPSTINAMQATAGVATIVSGVITSIAIGNPGRGYTSAPTVTITGGGGTGATATTRIIEVELSNAVSVFRRFTVTVDRYFNEPYESLYIQAMPKEEDRALFNSLMLNQDIMSVDLIYRADDPNFGLARNIIYQHALGLTSSSLEKYVDALELNHFRKQLVLGEIKVAQARLTTTGPVVYEVVYSEIQDSGVNEKGQSPPQSVSVAFPFIDQSDGSSMVSKVFPNSLINMRNQVIDTVGQYDPALPLWMTSKQNSGQILGFTKAFVLAYCKAGKGAQLAYNIHTRFNQKLNLINFEVDRLILDRQPSKNWNPVTKSWIPSPSQSTSFDRNARPSNIVLRGNVDYATQLAYSSINNQTLDRIAALGGIDGDIGLQLDNRTVIFQKQEDWTEPVYLTEDEAWTSYTSTYDQEPWDDTALDPSTLITGAANRLARYRMNIVNDRITLTLIETYTTNDSLLVTRGNTFAKAELYLPGTPTFGLTRVTWSTIPEPAGAETFFDGRSTVFIVPADAPGFTDQYNKYLLFPKINILGGAPPSPDPIPQPASGVPWINTAGAIVPWTNQAGANVNWVNQGTP